MAKRPPGYASEPAVPQKRLAGTNPLAQTEVGNRLPKTVPKHPGRVSGLVPGAHMYKAHLKHHSGHYRLSGVPTAHRIGFKSPAINKKGV